jgi:hypothetical protein
MPRIAERYIWYSLEVWTIIRLSCDIKILGTKKFTRGYRAISHVCILGTGIFAMT